MELVLDVVNRAGRTLERHRACGLRLTIGRAFDNDVILSDETVSPHHAVIQCAENGDIVVVDLESLNGTRADIRIGAGEVARLHSGNEYVFGRQRVRIFDTNHPVVPAVKIGGADGIVNRLSSGRYLALSLCIALAVAISQQWLNTYRPVVWAEFAVGVFGVLAIGVVIATFWAIVGRVIKHEGRFQTQLTLMLIYLLLQSAIVSFYEFVLFNSLNELASVCFFFALSFSVLASVFWFNLLISTHLNSRQRWRFATVMSALLLALSVFPEILEQTEFSVTPRYIDEIKPPFARISGGESVERFIEESSALFDKTNQDDDT
ncbi:MAG: hypothetical protein ACI9BW_000450 [Gammaproteobacteria bacterium]|jgi:hypothetical protein